ncbi:MAG: hypothetical protein EOP11_01790 [Proteobacteria bacterium]|nr:MAG: hypothetical protein EOP11_01790 [Pseudomonadota bacterium]
MSISTYVFLLLPLFTHAAEPVRPMKEMKGGCENYQTPLTQEFKDWELGPLTLATNEGKEGTLLPLNKRLKLLLQPASSVKFAKPPAKDAAKGSGAVIPLRVASTGTYKIAAGSRLWLEITKKNGEEIKAERFEMQTACATIAKVLTFKLTGGQDYLLQLAGAPEASVEIMLSREL